MAKPRRKISKQKAALRSIQRKKKSSEGDNAKSESYDHSEGDVRSVDTKSTSATSTTTPLPQSLIGQTKGMQDLLEKQKERRRRLMWSDEDDDDHEDDDEYDSDDSHNEEDECGFTCSNPECKNYSVDAPMDYEVPPYSFIIRNDWGFLPELTIETLHKTKIADSMNKPFRPLTFQRAGKAFLGTCSSQLDFERLMRERSIKINRFTYPIFTLNAYTSTPVESLSNQHDANSSQKIKRSWLGVNQVKHELEYSLRSRYNRDKINYERIQKLLASGRKALQINEVKAYCV